MLLSKKIIIAVVFLFFAGVAFMQIKDQQPDNVGPENSPPFVVNELTREEYMERKKEFLALLNTHDPRFALAQLREQVKTDDALLRSCHALVHEIGREAYKKYADFGLAMQYQDEICNSGYLHGIIETHLFKNVDVLGAIKVVCSPYPTGKYLSWECYHGVGHGVMYYTANDLPRSLEMCEKYENDFARTTCINGAFMENFNTDQKSHASKFLIESDPFYPCGEQPEHYKDDCYVYAPTYYLSLHKNDYAGALHWCRGAESPYVSSCIQGVGSQAMKENINTPKLVERICMGSTKAQVPSCIMGMVGLFINHQGSIAPAQKLCTELTASNQKACERSIKLYSHLFF